ncbi:unnamed protein product [Rhodiola kirilowii]
MSETEIVRLVRCPKCENLLPELAGYSFYQCGGCGAVLRAKVKEPEAEVLVEKSNEEKLGVIEKLGDLSGNGIQEKLPSLSENGVTGNGVSRVDIKTNCSAFTSKGNICVRMDDYLSPQPVPDNESIAKDDPYVSVGRGEVGNAEDLPNHFGNISRSQGSEHMPHRRSEISGQFGTGRGDNEGGNPFNSNYQEEGPSNYFSDSCYGNNAKPGKDTNGRNRLKNIDSVQKDQAELLQMMEELRDQLHQSGNLGINMKEKSHAAHQGSNRCSTSAMFKNKAAAPSVGMHKGFMPDKPTVNPYYPPHHLPLYPPAGRQRVGVSNPHPFPYGLSDMDGYENSFEMQKMRHQFPTLNHYEHQMPHPPYYPGHRFAADPIVYAPISNNGFLHHPVCGCYNCCSNHHSATQPDYPDDIRYYDIHNNPMLYPRNIPGPSAQQGYNLKTSGHSLSHNGHSVHARLADDDMARYTSGFVCRHQPKEALGQDGHHCQPIACGAPFIICQSCSKLLQLPKMTFTLHSKRQKLYCGACNTVMDCTFLNKKFTISVSGESKKIVKEVIPRLDDMTPKRISSELVRWPNTNSGSDDFDSSSHEFLTVNGQPLVLTRGLDLTSNETQDSQSLPPSSPASFEGVESTEGLASPSPHGLPLQDQLCSSFSANVTSRVWKGSQSTRSDHEKVMPKDIISRQNSLNETSATGRMEEVSFNVSSETQVHQNSEVATQRTDTMSTNKGSIFAGVIKKSLKGLSRSNHSAYNKDGNVTINGCKIPDRLVTKAEKLAGPIQPGNYWYDFRAGFWGVIGGPCLGIIPPFIEEFNYPMQANCSSGGTEVFVNGRELQQIDLDLLASRGLSIARGRSYEIEISGKVVDKDSGEELDGLGKLAPTIEKVKHGFGMKPRTQIV